MNFDKKTDLFFVVNNITNGKDNLFSDGLQESVYKPYLINKALSYYPDTIMHANEMNRYFNAPRKYQYEYLFRSIRKRKRFSKWNKKIENPDIGMLMEYYGVSTNRAEEYLNILTKEQIQKIRIKTNKGGLD